MTTRSSTALSGRTPPLSGSSLSRIPTNILFVGPEAQELQTLAAGPQVGSTARAESFVEAILVAGQGVDYQLIIADIGPELGHLQRAVQSLRSVSTTARIVLLAQPEDEPLARKALAWGANDYQILPTTLDKILIAPKESTDLTRGPRRLPTFSASIGKTSTSDAAAQIKLASLPVVVQSSMVDALLQGRSDLAARGVAILQSYMDWSGTIDWINAEAELPTENVTTAPVRHQDNAFGHLVHKSNGGNGPDMIASQLTQAGTWLGSWMALAKQGEQLRSLAITDELSGAYNRRYFHSFVSSLLEKARVERFRVTLLMFDIDNFKTYNDRFGHASGDAIIKQLITLLRRCTRENDLVARIGGDEFAVVFWDSEAPRQPNSEHPRDAVVATERFRSAIASHNWQEECKIKGEICISGGIASFPWDADTLEDLMATADTALLRAKKAGKNVILLHSQNWKDSAETV